MYTEQDLYNIARSPCFSPEEVFLTLLLDILNGQDDLDEIRKEINQELERIKNV